MAIRMTAKISSGLRRFAWGCTGCGWAAASAASRSFLWLGGGFRGFPLFLFLQHFEIVCFGIGAAGAAVVAGFSVVAVQGVAEGTVPVRIFADVFRLFFIQVLDISPFVFFPGFSFVISFHIELDFSAGAAAGRTVGHVSADLLGSADRAVPVSHDEISHCCAPLIRRPASAKKSCIQSSSLYIGTGSPSTFV